MSHLLSNIFDIHPSGHISQSIKDCLNLPIGQFTQEVLDTAPSTIPILPFSHILQFNSVDKPISSVYLPIGHNKHSSLLIKPNDILYFPLKQPIQVFIYLAHSPISQKVQLVIPSSLILPASQFKQLSLLFDEAIIEYFPDSQFIQLLEPSISAYLPASQSKQFIL